MPSSKNYKRDYQQENKYKAQPEQIEARVKRNQARKIMEDKGLVHKGDGKQVDHKKPLSKGGSNARSNLKVTGHSANESFRRNANAGLLSQISHKEAGKRRGR